MATLPAFKAGRSPEATNMASALAGNGVATNIVDMGSSHKNPVVRIITALGATPTCTYLIEVSADGVTYANATYADYATPGTDVATTFVITTAVEAKKIIKQPTPWRYIRVTMSANTNITNTIDLLYDDTQTPPWSF